MPLSPRPGRRPSSSPADPHARWSTEGSPTSTCLRHLTADEHALTDLAEDRYVEKLRFEQERIDWSWAADRVGVRCRGCSRRGGRLGGVIVFRPAVLGDWRGFLRQTTPMLSPGADRGVVQIDNRHGNRDGLQYLVQAFGSASWRQQVIHPDRG